MKLVIYGKEGCGYCQRAKDLYAKLATHTPNLDLELDYIDAIKTGMSLEDMAKAVGQERVSTFPQIKLIHNDGKEEYVGGFTEFYSYATQQPNWKLM